MKLSDAIGGTPLIFLETISRMIGANIFIKYEAGNPFGLIAGQNRAEVYSAGDPKREADARWVYC